jgi:UDP-N-acetylmuramyl pentapeptide phosphotransferase/UDP-N-acetylglucosamine-1-phosphate transferase
VTAELTRWLLTIGLAGVGSALLTVVAIAYAHRRAMLDLPGGRRSHAAPTPRGGGVGIVVVMLVFAAWLVFDGSLAQRSGIAFGVGLALVAAIGWIDDHRPLSALLRLAVHLVASTIFVWSLPRDAATELSMSIAFLQVMLLATAINFWNFMDGINGLIATQSAAVALCAMLLFGAAGEPAWTVLAAILLGACLGFLPFNFPRARIFLGDVGSGGLGFACGALLLQAQASGAVDALGAALVASVLLLDAGFTLANRMLRGRRWYNPHREHLYQWLVRRGRSHTVVTSLYLFWTLLVVMPVLWLMRSNPAWSVWLAAGVFASGAAIWFGTKRSLARRRPRGVSA